MAYLLTLSCALRSHGQCIQLWTCIVLLPGLLARAFLVMYKVTYVAGETRMSSAVCNENWTITLLVEVGCSVSGGRL